MMSTLGLTVTTVGNAIEYRSFRIPYSVSATANTSPLMKAGLGRQIYARPRQTLLHGKQKKISRSA